MAIASIPSITFTRPANTTAYTAGDVIGSTSSAIHELTSVASSSSYVFVQSIQLLINSTSVPSGMAGFRVHLYSSSPTAIADNAAYTFTSSDATAWQDSYDLGTPAVRGSMLRAQAYYQGGIMKLQSASSSMYAVLETLGAYTPASGTAHTLRVKVLEAGF